MSRLRIILVVLLGLVVLGAVIVNELSAPGPQEEPVARERPAAVPPAPPATLPEPRPAPPPEPTKPAAPSPAAEPAPAAATATLRIDSDVPDASVFIDRVYLGTTPLTVPNVSPGAHRLNASATGYEGIAENIDVVAGPRDILLKFKEIRLDVRMDVTHKHAVGSCTGTLSATPQGIKYATSHATDAFDAPLADITALDLDFLAKNLRLKLKSGKTYNFTETGGGADQLYAFHRDVDKVMKKKGQ